MRVPDSPASSAAPSAGPPRPPSGAKVPAVRGVQRGWWSRLDDGEGWILCQQGGVLDERLRLGQYKV